MGSEHLRRNVLAVDTRGDLQQERLETPYGGAGGVLGPAEGWLGVALKTGQHCVSDYGNQAND